MTDRRIENNVNVQKKIKRRKAQEGTQGETENTNRPVTSEKIELVIKNSPSPIHTQKPRLRGLRR